MFCPKCGALLEDGSTVCSSCGAAISEESRSVVTTSHTASPLYCSENTTEEKKSSVMKPVFFLLAILVFALSLYAASQVKAGGLDIGSIESVGGKTLEEAYYQYLGQVYAGYAMMIRTVGIFFASVLTFLGLKA